METGVESLEQRIEPRSGFSWPRGRISWLSSPAPLDRGSFGVLLSRRSASNQTVCQPCRRPGALVGIFLSNRPPEVPLRRHTEGSRLGAFPYTRSYTLTVGSRVEPPEPLEPVIIPHMSVCGGPASPEPPAGNRSGRIVFCQKFQKEMPGLDTQPWPGELGQRVYENISAEAWKLW